MIYLEAKAQQKLLATFHYALKPNGLLWLGPSETAGSFEERFTSVDKKWKLFTRDKAPGVLPYLERFAIGTPYTGMDKAAVSDIDRTAGTQTLSALIEQLLRERHVPVSVIANAQGEIVYITDAQAPIWNQHQAHRLNISSTWPAKA